MCWSHENLKRIELRVRGLHCMRREGRHSWPILINICHLIWSEGWRWVLAIGIWRDTSLSLSPPGITFEWTHRPTSFTRYKVLQIEGKSDHGCQQLSLETMHGAVIPVHFVGTPISLDFAPMSAMSLLLVLVLLHLHPCLGCSSSPPKCFAAWMLLLISCIICVLDFVHTDQDQYSSLPTHLFHNYLLLFLGSPLVWLWATYVLFVPICIILLHSIFPQETCVWLVK